MKTLLDFFQTEEELRNSTLSARLNGFVKGHGSLNSIKKDITRWGIRDEQSQKLFEIIDNLKW